MNLDHISLLDKVLLQSSGFFFQAINKQKPKIIFVTNMLFISYFSTKPSLIHLLVPCGL